MMYRVTLSVVVDSIETAHSLGGFIQETGKDWLKDGSMIALDPMAEATDIEAIERVQQIAEREGWPRLADDLLVLKACIDPKDET